MVNIWRKQVSFNNGTAVDVHDPGATKTAFVTKVVFMITTHANAKTLNLQDSAGSPVTYIAANDLTVAAGVKDVHEFNLSSSPTKGGIAMTLGKKVQVISQSAGPVATAYVEGYDL